jgi:chemotaxis signal transduction protein
MHVCSSICEGIRSLPPEYHESVIAQLTQSLGETPERVRIENISLSNARLVPDATPYPETELDQRRAIEGNTELARLPLALPTTYRYPPLPHGHARFLRLGGLGSHPSAYLESHPLENPPPYIAISYCWDPTSAKRGMFIDMQSLSISETVLEVLNQVQASQHATGSSERLWIDQICINQDDGSEKLDQIYRMGEIYAKAEKVFIWLGPTANQSDVALADMRGMLNRVLALNHATATRTHVADEIPKAINEDSGQLYGHIFMRPWFRRLWTVQEALLARKLIVMCGYQEVDFGLLVELAVQILTYGSLDLIQVPGASDEAMNHAIIGVVNLSRIRLPDASVEETLQGLNMGRFRALVTESRSRQVTMPADRVHALIGVAPHQIRAYMAAIQSQQPNQSLWELYAQFAKCMLENDPNWYFLSSAPSKDRPQELPSWVPNFNSQPVFVSELTDASYGFSAGISPETTHLIRRSINPRDLAAQGFRLDTISEIIPQTAFREDNQNTKHNNMYGDAAREWEQSCMRLCQRVCNLGPEQFPRFHVAILLAAAQTEGGAQQQQPLGGRAVDAYHVFWTGCRMRGETRALLAEGGFPLPERLRHLPDAVDRFADEAVASWRDGLSVDEYQLLLDFTGTMKAMCAGRPYVSTAGGLLGLACPGVQVGDVVCVLYGTTVPYVLRPRPDGAMTFVGDAYIYGAMNGEALSSPQRGSDETIWIR